MDLIFGVCRYFVGARTKKSPAPSKMTKEHLFSASAEQGADGLINIPSPGMPPKLNAIHKAFLARIVEEGPIPAIHGVVRWRMLGAISVGLLPHFHMQHSLRERWCWAQYPSHFFK